METAKKTLTRAEASGASFMRLQMNTNFGKKDDAFFLVSTLPGNIFVLQRLEYTGTEFVHKGKQIRVNSLAPFQKSSNERDHDLETGRRNTKNEHYGER
ncbi:MAG TPA: hypothetical protein PKG52_07400 [bacterium]|nr:hypothetical protein [bacterium]HPS30506.1 hypothetical protein [bacterium]